MIESQYDTVTLRRVVDIKPLPKDRVMRMKDKNIYISSDEACEPFKKSIHNDHTMNSTAIMFTDVIRWLVNETNNFRHHPKVFMTIYVADVMLRIIEGSNMTKKGLIDHNIIQHKTSVIFDWSDDNVFVVLNPRLIFIIFVSRTILNTSSKKRSRDKADIDHFKYYEIDLSKKLDVHVFDEIKYNLLMALSLRHPNFIHVHGIEVEKCIPITDRSSKKSFVDNIFVQINNASPRLVGQHLTTVTDELSECESILFSSTNTIVATERPIELSSDLYPETIVRDTPTIPLYFPEPQLNNNPFMSFTKHYATATNTLSQFCNIDHPVDASWMNLSNDMPIITNSQINLADDSLLSSTNENWWIDRVFN